MFVKRSVDLISIKKWKELFVRKNCITNKHFLDTSLNSIKPSNVICYITQRESN